MAPEETIELLNTYYTLMFDAISGHGGVVNQMIGDGLMAIFGAARCNPSPQPPSRSEPQHHRPHAGRLSFCKTLFAM